MLVTETDKLHELILKIGDIRANPQYYRMARKSSLFLQPGENPDVNMISYSGTQAFIIWAEDLRVFLGNCSVRETKQVADVLDLLNSFKGMGEDIKLNKIEAVLLALEKNYTEIQKMEASRIMSKSILARFPTEKLIFHKSSGDCYEVEAMVGTNSTIMSEDVSILIEVDDYFERTLPNGLVEYYKVVDTGYFPETPGIIAHYETKVQKVKANQLLRNSQNSVCEDGEKEMSRLKERNEIFISHREIDASFADIIKDFLVNTGIPNEQIFCSSLPGNDVNEQISPEVKERLKKCTIIILILSKNFYESPYCLNEAGVAWYLDEVTSIPIGLPEINHEKMIGFLNSDFKLRKLDNDDDISYLYDTAQEKLNVESKKHGVITRETKKLKERYELCMASREDSEGE